MEWTLMKLMLSESDEKRSQDAALDQWNAEYSAQVSIWFTITNHLTYD